MEEKLPTPFLFKRFAKVIFLYLATKFHFFLNFVPLTPVEASIKVTERCNSKCITCNVWKNNFRFKNDPSLEELEKLFYQLKEIGIKVVGFTGGEPLIRNDIGQLIEMAKKIIRGKVYIATNGLLLKEKAQTLVKNGIDYLSVSIDGLDKTDELIRGVPGHFHKAIEGIQVLKSLKPNIKINVGTTILKQNIKEIPQLIELCRKLKVKWSYNLLTNNLYFFQGIDISALRVRDEKLIDETIDYLKKTIKESDAIIEGVLPSSLEFARNYLKNKFPPLNCMMGYFRIYIDSKLNVYSGCWSLPPLGNLREKELKEIIYSKEYKQRVEKMFKLNCPKCTCGYLISDSISHLPSLVYHFVKDFKKYKSYLE